MSSSKKCLYYASITKTGKNAWPYELLVFCVVEKKSKGVRSKETYIVAGISHDILGKTAVSAATVWLVQRNRSEPDVIKAPLGDVILPKTMFMVAEEVLS